MIDNATKYTNDGGTVIVSVVEQNNHLIVNVEDNGVGISQKYLPRIFERFYRIDKSRSRQLGGTGLGLAIVKHIASLHNAKVDIKSEVNKGTQISISIPKIYAS